LVGNFNLPNIDWALLNSPDDGIQSVFLKFRVEYGLYQYVKFPTRDDYILDLVFSSDYSSVSDSQIAETFSTSDHSMVRFNTIVQHHENYPTSPTVVCDFDNADYDSIAHYILNNPFLSSCPMGETVDQVWENFVKPLNDAILLFVPTKVICTRSSKKAKWYTRVIFAEHLPKNANFGGPTVKAGQQRTEVYMTNSPHLLKS